MTLGAAVAVTAVVWAVSLITSVRIRALVYSLPLPMTLVLLASDLRVDGGQLIGVALLVGFFPVVGYAHERLGWHIALADAAGIAGYLGIGAAVAASGAIPFAPALLLVCAVWLLGSAVPRFAARSTEASADAFPAPGTTAPSAPGTTAPSAPVTPATPATPVANTPSTQGRLAALAKLAVVFAAALLLVGVAGLLRGLVVTFPYSGVLVAVEARRHLLDFARHFARASLALVAFLTGYWLLQDNGRAAALAAGWLAFAATATILHFTHRPTRRPPRPQVPDLAADSG